MVRSIIKSIRRNKTVVDELVSCKVTESIKDSWILFLFWVELCVNTILIANGLYIFR